MVGINMEMPKNCVECNHMDLQQAINCQLIYSGCANCGRHPNCPLVEIGTCKDCKHWKDSDGVYRRGVGAESKCPINIKEVYEGNFYCADFARREE